ncbi:glycerol-3-phosphate cytidylyltransferase [Thermogladius calderae 1633]|uniref:Glycerol-3-phosphate cytidylyltransferase n=1 Tax=Thermogladius calderae (strain DSM 22663 / VKM B-2946 / 1633) TaxID=1184251 RepID=I3TET3_THEC1|nr:DUF357 domain-containing protein [Thermogladius calderae]AFK51271.1 glycerol-3-phosphate cytidylyltransferase [Thermogladius calderae 1633]
MEERVRAYVLNVEKAISTLSSMSLDEESRGIVELARAYLSDSKYYLEKGDVFTSLACIAYAEGLLDALKRLGKAEFGWEPLSKLLARPKVLVAGAFEILHPGHLHLLKKAWELGRVHVIVARDSSIRRIKGREPVVPEQQRLEVVSAVKYVDTAVLGDEEDFLKPVEHIKPDIILLGPDQWITPEGLSDKLEGRGIRGVRVMRLPERIGDDLYSTSGIIRRVCSQIGGVKKQEL